MPDDTVRLVIAGREFSGWTACDIGMAIDTLADSFSLTCPYDPELADLVAAIEPYKYQGVQILIGDEPYLSGRLDADSFDSSSDSGTCTLQGRSLPGILTDCSVEVDDTAQAEDLTFAQIAARTAKPLGIKIRDDDSQSATRKIPEARAEYGKTAFDFLHTLAAPHNLLLNSSFDGKLVITHGDDLMGYPIRAALSPDTGIITHVSSSFNASKRYSLYTIASQFAGEPDISGSARDSSVPIYRPTCKVVEETDANDPSATASRMMSEAIASSLSVTVTCAGWRRPDGKRWSERQAVTLYWPRAYIRKVSRFVIAGCSLRLTPDDGYTTELRLVPPEVYSTAIAKAGKKKVDLW